MPDLVTQYVLPVAVLVSAAATTTTAVIAWQLYQSVKTHERALFGEEAVDGHDGMIEAVNDNTERSERNRRVLRANDMVPPGPDADFRRPMNGWHYDDDEQEA